MSIADFYTLVGFTVSEETDTSVESHSADIQNISQQSCPKMISFSQFPPMKH